jgi:hypothetical protein
MNAFNSSMFSLLPFLCVLCVLCGERFDSRQVFENVADGIEKLVDLLLFDDERR